MKQLRARNTFKQEVAAFIRWRKANGYEVTPYQRPPWRKWWAWRKGVK